MTITNSSLKPFVINNTDIQFLLDQVKFRPLFDSAGNAIFNWNGVGSVYNAYGTLIGTGGAVAGDPASVAAIAAFGTSYQNVTDLAGLRDPSGFNNNLTLVHAHWGQAGFDFPRMAKADFTGYSLQAAAAAETAYGASVQVGAAVGSTGYVASNQDLAVSDSTSISTGTNTHTVTLTGHMVETLSSTVNSIKVQDGHHTAVTLTQAYQSVDTTTNEYDFSTTSTTTTKFGGTQASVTVSGPVTTKSNEVFGTLQQGTLTAVGTAKESGGELDGSKHVFSSSLLRADMLAGADVQTIAQHQTDYALAHQSYTIAKDLDTLNSVEGDTHASDGTAINIKNVVDYTPRMISRLTTTGDVVYDTWANHEADNLALPVDQRHAPNEIYYDSKGVATVLNWGRLETAANGGEGQVDTQARLAASAGQNDHFIGGLNPGVSPSNGFFVLFGQFFDHGLDFIDKGQADANGKAVTIKIALAVDDPLYGMKGPDGQPVTSITINRAIVDTVSADGSPQYVNHTSPYIDQSQTYGSNSQLTNLLREWVADDPAHPNSYHAGMALFDGNTLATPWVNGHGQTVTSTLPTLNELRAHLVATGRDDLSWEDVTNLRNRGADGNVLTSGPNAGNSGSALILDSNPRFDMAHLHKGDAVQDASVDASIGHLTAYVNGLVAQSVIDHANDVLNNAPNPRPDLTGLTFGLNLAGTTLQLTMPAGFMGPGSPATTVTGASALALFVNFANFSIQGKFGPLTPSLHDDVSNILMASVGDHYIAGDGRVNENFGLTSIHHIFHEEHNFQVTNLMEALHTQDIATNDATHAKLHEFQINTGTMNSVGDYTYGVGGPIAWDMDKMFNATKLIVEMEYQHAAVDQYARNVTPNIQEFVGYSPDKDPSVTLEYAQGAFRFGHSTLRETIDTIDPTHGLTGKIMGYALRDAFLNPDKYADIGPASILLGMSHQQQNEVDEFITPALNQGLLGQPLDLAAINIARGRDIGLPTLNDFRAAIGLARYTSWTDFGQNMQHPSSLVNFIAAYSFDGDMAKAKAIMGLADGSIAEGSVEALGLTVADANLFLNGGDTGFNHIDTWLGGLAEIHQPGGLLGETFDKVFVTQIESLMDGDRFYYLYRLAGQQFAEEVGNGQLKDIVERNTGLVHLNGNIFGYADQYVDFGAKREVAATGVELQTTGNEHKYGDIWETIKDTNGNIHFQQVKVGDGALATHAGVGIYSNGGLNAVNDGGLITIDGRTYIQDTRLADSDPSSAFAQNGGVNLDGTPNSGAESNEVIVGTDRADMIYAQGGDDTVYGEGGNDIIYGGFGIDRLYGGMGHDTIYGGDNPDLMDGGSGDDRLYGESSGSDINGNDQVIGGSGNDFISGGTGIDKLSGGTGDDHIMGDQDTDPFTHGSDGNDWVEGNSGGDILYGDNGDDLLEGGADQDQMFGGLGDDIIRPGDPTGALTIGSDEVLGNDGVDLNDTGFDLIDYSDNSLRPGGVSFDLGNQLNPAVVLNGTPVQTPSFQMDGVVGSVGDDTLTGSDTTDAGNGADVSIAGHNWLIGGSGNDTLTGSGGNDVIVGGSIRLDALVGKYTDKGIDNLNVYDNNNNNWGLTAADLQQDALYQGASHRALYTDHVTGGLLAGAGFDLHLTEMLRSDQFKDMVLGDSAGLTAGGNDTAVYTGNLAQYSMVALDVNGIAVANPHANWNNVFAIKITDNRTAADLVDANGAPLVDANGNPLVNEGTDVVVGVGQFKFADQTINPAAYFDAAPVLDLNYTAVPSTIQIAADNFGGAATAYARGTGWAGDWTESGDLTTAPLSNTGAIRVTGGNARLEFLRETGAGGDGAMISRAINLAGLTAADTPKLNFSLAKSGIGAGETLQVQYSSNGTTWTTLKTYGDGTASTDNATGNLTVDLSGQTLTATSAIRFSVSQLGTAADYFRVDDISVTKAGPTTDGAAGVNFSSAYTEGGAAAHIAATAVGSAPLITDPDTIDTTIVSAKIVVTDSVAGDVLSVGGLPAGISASGNGTGLNGMTGATVISLTGVASHAAYQTALQAISFSSTSLDPTNHGANPARHVAVTVNDGFKDSAVATTTIAVTGVDNAATALAADTVITNIAVGNTNIAIPLWALAANDTDVDGAVITAIGGGVGVQTTGNGTGISNGNAVVRDTTTAGNTFTYTVANSVPANSTATVTINHDTAGALDGTANADIIIGDGNASTINGNGGNDAILAGGGDDTVNGGAGMDTIYGGTGDDTINAGDNDDIIVWNAGNGGGDGSDVVDGGNNDAAGDRFVLNGNGQAETFRILSILDPNNGAEIDALLNQLGVALNPASTILITRTTTGFGGGTQIVAELRNIEEITINNQAVTTGGGNTAGQGADTVQIVGDFNGTGLAFNTITINGSSEDDTVDISGLTSAHRIVFNSGSGNDHVIGDVRPQDVVNIGTSSNSGGSTGGTGGSTGGSSGGSGSNGEEDNSQGGGTGSPAPAPVVDQNLMGDDNDNLLSGGDGDNAMAGNDGDDLMSSGNGANHVMGGAGDDTIVVGDGNNVVFGGAGDDAIFTGNGNNLIDAGKGDDNAFGGSGDDTFVAHTNDGADTYHGGAGTDTLDMSAIMTNIEANLGTGLVGWAKTAGVADTLYNVENIITGAGDDRVTASGAHNVIDLGDGHDTVVFRSASDANGDTILNFQAGDKIDMHSMMSGTVQVINGTAAGTNNTVALEYKTVGGEEFTTLHGQDNNGHTFDLDVKGHHVLNGTDFAA